MLNPAHFNVLSGCPSTTLLLHLFKSVKSNDVHQFELLLLLVVAQVLFGTTCLRK